MTAPRGITQPPTSFIGSQCQGIHHAPLYTYNTKNQRKIRNYTTTNHTPTPNPNGPNARRNPPTGRSHVRLDARNHYPQIKHHTPPPRWSDNRHPPPGEAGTHPPQRGGEPAGLLPQDPTVCPAAPRPGRKTPTTIVSFVVVHPNPVHYRPWSIQRIAQHTEPPHGCGRVWVSWCSLERR